MPEDVETSVVEETPAESSPTDTQEPSSGIFDHVDLDMADAEREEWLAKGTIPERFKDLKEAEAPNKEQKAETVKPKSATKTEKPETKEPPKTSAETTETEGASETPVETSDPASAKPPGAKAEQRKKQLAAQIQEQLAERKRLDTEIADRQRKIAELNKAPAAPARPATPASELPKKPKQDDFPTWDEYEAAKDKYFEDLLAIKTSDLTKNQAQIVKDAIQADRKERETAEQQAQIQETNKQLENSWKKRLAATAKRHPEDFKEAAFVQFPNGTFTPAMDEFLLESDHGAEILYRLGKDYLEGGDEAERIGKLNPYRAAVALGEIEKQIAEELKPPVTKPVLPRATKPPTDLGGKNAAPEDEADAALQSGDFKKYSRIMNEREAKSRGY